MRSFAALTRIAGPMLAMLVVGAAAQESIAVIDFEARGIAVHEAAIIAERFRGALVRSGQFKVMERGQMESILHEQGFQQSGACTDASCLVEMGQLLAVSTMLTGSVGRIGTMYTIDIKQIDIRTGQIQFTQSQDIRGSIEDVLLTAVPTIADELIQGAASMSITVGYVTVFSEPSGAVVSINGEQKGTTPLREIELPAGEYKLALSLEGFVEQERTLSLLRGRTQELRLTLSPTAERLAAQREQAGARRKTLGRVIRWTGAVLAAGGFGAATYFWLDADFRYDSYTASINSQEATELWEQTERSAFFGNISAIIGGVGAIALGVSFVF